MDYRYDHNLEPVLFCGKPAQVRSRYSDVDEPADAGIWMSCDACTYDRFIGTISETDTVYFPFLAKVAEDHDYNHSSMYRAHVAA